MATELPRPGIEVIQEFRSTSPAIVRPALVAFICGAAKEVVEVTTADGLLNPAAKQGTYSQLPKTINQTAFPSPRGNILEVNVEEKTVKAFLLSGGQLVELERDPGESFLTAWNNAARATVQTLEFDEATGLALHNKIIVLAIDVASRLNTTQDVTVTFSSSSPTPANLTADQIVDQINNAVGEDVAVKVGSGAETRVSIGSTAFGARSSVTVRPGGSANSVLGFSASQEIRVTGSGFRAVDLANNTTISPFVEWTKGGYFLDGVSQSAFPSVTTNSYAAGLTNSSADFAPTFADDLTFTGAGSIDLKVGDEFWADGAMPNSARVMKVESKKFKLGTINPTLSVYDSDGKVVSAVYDASNLNTLFSSTQFSPRYGWFRAKNLVIGSSTSAVLTGATKGKPAELASIMSTDVIDVGSGLPLSGLTLRVVVTEDGVEGDEQVFTFSGAPFVNVAAIAAAIDIDGVVASEGTAGDVSKLVLSTTKTGKNQGIRLKKESTANEALLFSADEDTETVGKDSEFRDISATTQTSGNSFPLTSLATNTLVLKLSADGGTTFPVTRTHTFGAGPFANIAAVIADIEGDAPFLGGGTADLAVSASGVELVISTVGGGSGNAVKVDSTSTGIGGAGKLAFTASQTDTGEENLTGQILKFKLNDRTRVYEVVFETDSLADAVTTINETVGFPLASLGGLTEEQISLTSPLSGKASKVEIVSDTTSAKACAALGFGSGNQVATGTGRPNPDFYLDVSGNVVLGAEILRSTVTGAPFNAGGSDVYLQYIGLRKDVSPVAVEPAVLNIGDLITLQTVLGPLTQQNPLGLGMFFAMINAPGLVVSGMGVDETSASEPYGTPAAFGRVANFVEKEEIYSIACMTDSETVAQIFNSHVLFMSKPENKGERILFFAPAAPVREVDDVVASGLSGNSTATANEFVLDVNPTGVLTTKGIDIAEDIPVDSDLFLELAITTSSGQVIRRYSVEFANGVVLTLRNEFEEGENDEGFFTTDPLGETLVNTDWKLAIRGVPLFIPGSAIPDRDRIAETVQKKAEAYKQRRLYYVFPDRVKGSIGGVEEIMPAFYACAATCGLVAGQPPQQGFTNLPISGFTGVLGSNDSFAVRQLNVMAAGGTYILVQDVEAGPVVSRHQLSTNTTTLETRELSITKIVDFVAKFLRVGVRNFIGTFNITQPFLDMLSTVLHGMLKFLEERGVIISGDLNNLIQSKDNPDTVLVDVTLDVPFPCNYIRLTIVI